MVEVVLHVLDHARVAGVRLEGLEHVARLGGLINVPCADEGVVRAADEVALLVGRPREA